MAALDRLRHSRPFDFEFWDFPSAGAGAKVMVGRGEDERRLLDFMREHRIAVRRISVDVHG